MITVETKSYFGKQHTIDDVQFPERIIFVSNLGY